MGERYDNDLYRRIGRLGASQSVLATKPRRAPLSRAFGYGVLVVMIAFVALFWSSERTQRPLARALPENTLFYASFNLGAHKDWRRAVLFWKPRPPDDSLIAGLLGRISGAAFPGVAPDDAAGLFSGLIEFAELPSRDLVIAGTLADSERLSSLSGVPDITEGELYPGRGILGGLLEHQEAEWVWFVRDNLLYAATSARAARELGAKPDTALAQALSESGERGNLGTIYVSGSAASAITEQSVVQLFLQGSSFPVVLDFYYSTGKITFSSTGRPEMSSAMDLSSAPASPALNLYERFGGDAAVYLSRAGESYGEWVAGLPSALQEEYGRAQELLGAFYGTDAQPLMDVLADSELVFLFNAPGTGGRNELSWLALAGKDVPEALVLPAAATIFAATHPEARDIPLADGTSMVELRASREGLVWEPLAALFGGQEAAFRELKGAGELAGIATGVIPGLGRVLTNDISLAQDAREASQDDACSASGHKSARARVSGSLLSAAYPALSFIERLTITSSGTRGIFGCVQLASE